MSLLKGHYFKTSNLQIILIEMFIIWRTAVLTTIFELKQKLGLGAIKDYSALQS